MDAARRRGRTVAEVNDEDPFASASYARFVSSMRKYCHCCSQCAQTPCDGVLAGGMCDEWCTCDDTGYESNYHDIDDE